MSMRLRCGVVALAFMAQLSGVSAADGRHDEPRAAAGPAVAADQARRAEVVARLFDLGSSRLHVVNWQRALAGQPVDAGEAGLSGEMRERLRRAWGDAVATSFNVDQVMVAWQSRLAAQASLGDLEHQMAFDVSTLGKRLNGIARSAVTEDLDEAAAARRLAEGTLLVKRDPRRARLVGRILSALDMETGTIDFVCSLQLATLAGVIQETPDRSQAGAADIAALAGQCTTLMREQLAPTLLPSYAEMWAQLTYADLEAYARHVEQPATRRVVRVSRAISTDLIRRSALAVGRSFVREFRAERL